VAAAAGELACGRHRGDGFGHAARRRRRQDVLRELRIGGWLQWGALLAAGIASPMLCANAAMSGKPLPTFLELLGPREGRTGSVLTALLGLTLVVTLSSAPRPRSALRSIRATAIFPLRR
jgi:hypothetical protein